MGHARYEDLKDLEDVLDGIRGLPAVSEPTPGIFYIGRTPFLHFHTKAGERWADAKSGTAWGAEMRLPFGAGKRLKSAFLLEVRERHRRCAGVSAAGGRSGFSARARRREGPGARTGT